MGNSGSKRMKGREIRMEHAYREKDGTSSRRAANGIEMGSGEKE